MTREEFIDIIAPLCIKYAKKYGFKNVSAAIGQACLESGFGSADNIKVKNNNIKVKNNNIFGLKYRPNRLTCNSGYVEDTSKEQNPDGTYRDIIDKWFSFTDIEHGVEGYYQFINIPSYSKVKEQTDTKRYLEEIKAVGYASSLNYVDKVLKIVIDYNLLRFNKLLNNNTTEDKEDINIIDVDFYGKKQGDRTKPVSKITIHHMAGNMGAKRCAEWHRDSNKKASANFYIGTNGDIVRGIPENKRAWTSSSPENDNVALTIEVANNSGAPNWTVSEEAYNSLIKLCAYICKKYNINLVFTGDKTGTLTIHKMFSATACPGPYLESKIRDNSIINDVNKLLGKEIKETKETTADNLPYLVRVKITDLNIRESHTTNSRSRGFIKPGVYTIVEEVNGWGKLKSGIGYIYLKYTERA